MPGEEIKDFRGVARDIHRARLSPDQFQIDEGGDHYERQTWKLRRGQVRTTIDTQTDSIQTLLGFEIPGGAFSTLVVAGATATGEQGVGEQEPTVDESGFGEGGFGEGGFGA